MNGGAAAFPMATPAPTLAERTAKNEMRAKDAAASAITVTDDVTLVGTPPPAPVAINTVVGGMHLVLSQPEYLVNAAASLQPQSAVSAASAASVPTTPSAAAGSSTADDGAPRASARDGKGALPTPPTTATKAKGKRKAPAGPAHPASGRFKKPARPMRSLPVIGGLRSAPGSLPGGAAAAAAESSAGANPTLMKAMTAALEPFFQEVKELIDTVMELKDDVSTMKTKLDTNGQVMEGVRAATTKIEESLQQSGTTSAAVAAGGAATRQGDEQRDHKDDFSAYKDVERVRSRVRASLSSTFASILDSGDVIPDGDTYRDLIHMEAQTELNLDEDAAHDWLMGTVTVPPRRAGAPTTVTRVLVVLLRVKSHWVQALKKRILNAYFHTIEMDERLVQATDALGWIEGYKYFESVVGRKGILAALAAALTMTGGGVRIVKPSGVGDGTVIEATTRHFAFVCAVVRGAFDQAAGANTDASIGEAFYQQLEVEQERVDVNLPTDNCVHDGLRLTDGLE